MGKGEKEKALVALSWGELAGRNCGKLKVWDEESLFLWVLMRQVGERNGRTDQKMLSKRL